MYEVDNHLLPWMGELTNSDDVADLKVLEVVRDQWCAFLGQEHIGSFFLSTHFFTRKKIETILSVTLFGT